MKYHIFYRSCKHCGNSYQDGHIKVNGHQCSHLRQKDYSFQSICGGSFLQNIVDLGMITNPTNVSLSAYSYLSTVKQNSEFLLILKLKEQGKFENCSNIFTGQEYQIIRHTYAKY